MLLNRQNLPSELLSIISGENIEFLVYSKRKYTSVSALKFLAFGLSWFVFSCLLLHLVVSQYYSEIPSELNILNVIWLIVNDLPCFILSLFVVVGIVLLIIAISRFVMKGDYFIGTPTRLICYNRQKIVYHYWFIFQEKICVYPKTGDIIFKLQTGRIYNRNKSSGTYFVSDKIEIASIENVNHIEQVARKRIKEHSQSMFLETKK